jgi:hypothetical protein
MNNYYCKYIKYKNKYITLKNQNLKGGTIVNVDKIKEILRLFFFPETEILGLIYKLGTHPSISLDIILTYNKLESSLKPNLRNIDEIKNILKDSKEILDNYIHLIVLFMKLYDIDINENTLKEFLKKLLNTADINEIKKNYSDIINKLKDHTIIIDIIKHFINPEFTLN